jgi:hypothetical protein
MDFAYVTARIPRETQHRRGSLYNLPPETACPAYKK